MSRGFSSVLIRDYGVDAALVERQDGCAPTLILRPAQTLSSAVAAVRAVVPSLAVGEAETVVRTNLPDARDLDDMLGLALTDTSPVPVTPRSELRYEWAPTFTLALTLATTLIGLAFYAGSADVREEVRMLEQGAFPVSDTPRKGHAPGRHDPNLDAGTAPAVAGAVPGATATVGRVHVAAAVEKARIERERQNAGSPVPLLDGLPEVAQGSAEDVLEAAFPDAHGSLPDVPAFPPVKP